ncbi:MAG: hypothetical protein K0Q74_1133 [Gammaproteobacteria bacterium]|nr:hypothetical protein [Gammaproteobacteria bacterium]
MTKSNYVLEPHLSLLYAHMDHQQQKALATEIIIPHKKIIFDQIKAISTQTHVHSSKDVKEWVEIASANL